MNLREIERELESEGEIAVRKLEEWAEKTGNKTYIYYGEENRHISYKEFNELANSIGHQLQSLGIEKGDRVCLFLRNPLVTVLAMFGIWKIGAVYCPINFNYKIRQLSYQITDIKPQLLICDTDRLTFVNEIKDDIPSLPVVVHRPAESEHDYNPLTAGQRLDKTFTEYSFDQLLTGDRTNIRLDLEYFDTANIIYTSGTTGPAKGVVQSHRWMNQFTFRARKLMTQDDVIYNDLPLYHVGGAFANVGRGAWLGCTVALWDKFSSSDFWRRIEVSGATIASLMDVVSPWLMSVPETANDRNNTLNKVYLTPLPQYHNKLAQRFGIDFVFCTYAQTELGTGLGGIFEELEEGEGTPPELYKGYKHEEIRCRAGKYGVPIRSGKEEMKRGYLGKPFLFLDAVVLNERDEHCAPGAVGQLAFRPKFPSLILKEYLGKPDATLKAMRNCWLHTGDACYKDEEDNFFFVDRMGGFIRTRGENVSSSQIEDIVNSHTKVDMCAAFPIPAQVGDEDDVVLYAVVKSGEMLDENELGEWIRDQMPKFMRPKHIRFLDELPKTPNNKVEKYKLRQIILKELGKN